MKTLQATEALGILRRYAPSESAAIFAVGVSGNETGGWGRVFGLTGNWGMIQLGSKTGPFLEVRDCDANGREYRAKLRVYPDREAGAKDLVDVLFSAKGRKQTVLPAASSGDFCVAVKAMAASNYFETRQVTDYLTNVLRWGKKAAGPRPEIDGMGPVLQHGDVGEQVDRWHQLMGVPAGSIDRGQVKKYQDLHGIVADGKVGPQTWAHALMAAV